jgi:uncharacterized membrane protein
MFSILTQKVYAAGTPIDTNTLIQNIMSNIVNPFVVLMLAVAVLYFLWGVFEFVRNAESSEERKKGGQHMLWGAIGLAIMTGAYGILNLIIGTINPTP